MGSYLARWAAPLPPTFAKARFDAGALTCKSLLTYPILDLAGDYVEPLGCDFTSHQRDPGIDLEHGRHPLVKGRPVAWARTSLSEPGAPYAVEMARLDFAPAGRPPQWHTVPVGTEYYDRADKLSMQVFALRRDGSLPASSLEFRAVPGHCKALGRSPLEPRQAQHFYRTDVVRWTVCAVGVNPGALTVTKALGHVPLGRVTVPESLQKVLRDRRVNVGGAREALHGHILKALGPYLDTPLRTLVRVEKAMDLDDDDAPGGAEERPAGDETASALEEETAAGAEPGDGPTPTAQAAYDLAQGASDLGAQIRAGMARGEHKAGRKKLTALCERLDQISQMAMSVGKGIDSDLSDESDDGTGDETGDEGGEGDGGRGQARQEAEARARGVRRGHGAGRRRGRRAQGHPAHVQEGGQAVPAHRPGGRRRAARQRPRAGPGRPLRRAEKSPRRVRPVAAVFRSVTSPHPHTEGRTWLPPQRPRRSRR